jgi:aminopeptidase N
VTSLRHQWNYDVFFFKEISNQALIADESSSQKPIQLNVKYASDIRSIFDITTYAKGGCVTQMIKHYLGHSQFYKGIYNFLTKFSVIFVKF